MRKRQLLTAGIVAAVAGTTMLATSFAVADEADATSPDPRLRTTTNVSTAAELDAYWTPERIAGAKPAPAPDGSTDVDPAAIDTAAKAVSVDAEPSASGDITGVAETEGRLLFSTNDGDYMCSGTVVTGDNKSVVATARHCGFTNGGSNYRFAPNYSGGNTPFGWWDWKSASWLPGEGITNDWAFLSLNQKDGRPVADVVGSSGIGFNQTIDEYTHIVGIPGDKDVVFYCEGDGYTGPDSQQLMDNCDGMSGGASGGAWVHNWADNGSGMQVGTFFGSYGDAAAGSYFNGTAYEAYDNMQHT
ncbi:MAG: trypsin-like serine peptidase [Stackebrandtia sp.]